MHEENRAADEGHEQNLLQLLDEMGRTLTRREKLFEEIEGRHAQVRNSWVQESADRPLGQLDAEALADELRWELERQREQELELHQILDVVKHQCELEDRVLEELEPYLIPEHRDRLYEELKGQFERRDEILDGVEFGTFPEKRNRILVAMEHLRALEETLSRVIERHLVQRHRA